MDPPAIAVFDANVLYRAPLRDLLLRLAHAGLIRARWTEEILVPDAVRAAVKAQRESLRNPPRTAEELLATLEAEGCPKQSADFASS